MGFDGTLYPLVRTNVANVAKNGHGNSEFYQKKMVMFHSYVEFSECTICQCISNMDFYHGLISNGIYYMDLGDRYGTSLAFSIGQLFRWTIFNRLVANHAAFSRG